jgi:hypothetical protein
MAAAMREARIRSPRTAYLWWRRFQQAGQNGLVPRSRARKTQRTVPADIAERACALRRTHPAWGRRKIAEELAVLSSRPVVSPAGVEAVLRRAGLWAGRIRPIAPQVGAPRDAVQRAIFRDLDQLIPSVIEGIDLSLRSRAEAAVAVLGAQVWDRLGKDRSAWFRLLNDPSIGDLLLRSRIQLGHSLMSSGRWRAARDCLGETLAWLQHVGPAEGEPAWRGPPVAASLRRDDVWIECYQYLGIVLRDRSPALAWSYLASALAAIRSRSRTLVPTCPAVAIGNLERNLAKLGLRTGRVPDAEIEARLRSALNSLEETGDRPMVAATLMTWAKQHARRAERARGRETETWLSALESMEAATEQALAGISGLDTPMLQTDFLIDAAQLYLAHDLPVDERGLRHAAANCLTYGYWGQARQIPALPNADRLLSAELIARLVSASPGVDA